MNGLRVPQKHQPIQPKCIYTGPSLVPRSVIVGFGLTLVVICYVEAYLFIYLFMEDRGVDGRGMENVDGEGICSLDMIYEKRKKEERAGSGGTRL